jgi:hypothetical protein
VEECDHAIYVVPLTRSRNVFCEEIIHPGAVLCKIHACINAGAMQYWVKINVQVTGTIEQEIVLIEPCPGLCHISQDGSREIVKSMVLVQVCWGNWVKCGFLLFKAMLSAGNRQS